MNFNQVAFKAEFVLALAIAPRTRERRINSTFQGQVIYQALLVLVRLFALVTLVLVCAGPILES